jgi:hypothetical protein
MYDRWGDSFNIPTEFTVINLSRSLASLAYWMARSPLKDQPWKSASSKIVDAGGMYGLRVENVVPPESGNLDPQKAQVLWESVGSPDAPEIGVIFQPRGEPKRIEVEAIWPDGRRTTTKR